MKIKLCKKCKQPMRWCGFERNLITRGVNKGQYTVKEYYTCDCCSKGEMNEHK